MTDNTEKQTADTTAAETVKTEESTPTDAPENAEQPEKKVEIIGVRFKQGCKTYYFAAGKNVAKVGDSVIVDTARGLELVSVALANKLVSEKEIVSPLRPVIRVATQNDLRRAEENHRKESEAYEICKKKITEHKLDMSLVGAEYTFDNAKLLFYFTSDGRVDFRDLVKDLASVFCTRIELRQIGVRHETQMLGALGNCGMVCCCRRYLRKFAPVTIKMAKEQNLFLNPAKISGICGRLLCCLSYEQDNYDAFHRSCPKLGKRYQTDLGPMRVLRGNMFRNAIVVLPDGGQETEYSLEEWQELHPHRAETPPPAGSREQRPNQELMVVSAAPDTLDADLAELDPAADPRSEEMPTAAEARPKRRRRRKTGPDQEQRGERASDAPSGGPDESSGR